MNLTEHQFWLDGKQLANVCGSKCGLVTVSAFEDQHVFQLNCLFCPNVFSCFENFVSHIKIKHPPVSVKYSKNDTDNETDREQPDELACDNLLISDEFKMEIKVEYEQEEASNVTLSREHLRNELHGNQSNDDAEFMSEDGENSMKTLFHHPKNEIKLEFEETTDFTLNQERLCPELQENQSKDYAEFLSEDEHSVSNFRESSHVTSKKDSEVYRVQRIANPKDVNLTLDIIKMWKNYPYLWNNKRDNWTKKKRAETWDKIVHSLKQKWDCEVPKDALLRKIRSMRGQYYEAVRKSRKATTSKKVPEPWFFEELSFLTPQINYNCEECDEVFRSEDAFKYHQYTHDGIGRFPCDVCEKQLASVINLKMHKRMHAGLVVQENQSNDDADDVEDSMETVFHSPKNEIKLEEQSDVTINQEVLCTELQEHQSNDCAELLSESQHSVEASHVTSSKDSKDGRVQRMAIPKNYNLTLDIIKMWKKYPCLWNNKRDNWTNKKRDETWDKIVKLLKKKWNCEVPKDALLRKIRCMRKQYYKAVRSSRKATTSKKVPVPWYFEELSFLTPRTYYNCEECDEVFRSEDSFKYHQYTHDGMARFICDVCYKEFASVRLLMRHKVTHLDVSDRPHECKICGRKFPIKAQLTIHMRRHTKENCFSCSECNKLFPTKGTLKSHMRSKNVHSSTDAAK